MKAFYTSSMLAFAIACASAQSKGVAQPPRAIDPDVVDLRGIWLDTHIDAAGAVARGLDPAQVVAPRKVRDVPPKYPMAARYARVTGTVTVECIIDLVGVPHDCSAVGGPGELRDVSVAAVREWRWQPLTVGGVPRRALVHVTVNFRLY
jgi:TonB family protein